MSDNSSFLLDEDGDYSDWIEIYNGTNQVINIQDYYLTDDGDDLTKWKFPSISIEPASFLLIYASDKDRSIAGDELHTNFRIKSSGEDLFLTFNGSVISSFPSTDIRNNRSFGAYPDGSQLYTLFGNPTPGASNSLPTGVADVLSFSIKGGEVISTDKLSILNSNTAYQIRYTIDGSEPAATSAVFPSQGLFLDSSLLSATKLNQVQMSLPASYHAPVGNQPQAIVIRAATFDTGGVQKSATISNSYFNGQISSIPKGLPNLSIMIDPTDLTDHDSGLFVLGQFWDAGLPFNSGNFFQKGIAWERPIHLEYFENGFDSKIKQDAGLRLHGYSSRTPPQKALRLYARSSYGDNDFDHDLFSDRSYDSYRRLTLKPFMATWGQYGAADHLFSSLAKRGFNVDYLSSRPVTLYINGEYWGIYLLAERIDEHFLSDLSGYEQDSIDLIEGWQGLVSEGNGREYSVLTDAVINYDLTISQNYARVETLMDIDNFIDYQILQMFTVNYDWPQNNMKCWKSREPGAKWRWIAFDGDAAYSGVNFDMFAHTLDSTSTALGKQLGTQFFRQLIKNKTFKNSFFQRLDEVLQNELNYNDTQLITERINKQLNPHIVYQSNRFGKPTDEATWEVTTSYINRFLAQRGCNMMRNAKRYFDNSIVKNYCFNENNTDVDVQVFPNPTDGYFTLGIDSQIEFSGVLTVYSIRGKKVYEKSVEIFYGINGFKLDLSEHTAGIYFVNISGGTQRFSHKIIVH